MQPNAGHHPALGLDVRQRRRDSGLSCRLASGLTSAASAASAPPTSLAAAPGATGNLTLATTTGIYVLSTETSRWTASNATGTGAPTGGFSYVGMTTDEQGVALPADTSLHEIWMTFDGGTTWTPSSIAGN